jgi:hypothetical protein
VLYLRASISMTARNLGPDPYERLCAELGLAPTETGYGLLMHQDPEAHTRTT